MKAKINSVTVIAGRTFEFVDSKGRTRTGQLMLDLQAGSKSTYFPNSGEPTLEQGKVFVGINETHIKGQTEFVTKEGKTKFHEYDGVVFEMISVANKEAIEIGLLLAQTSATKVRASQNEMSLGD